MPQTRALYATWVLQNKDFGSVEMQEIKGSTMPRLSLLHAYQVNGVNWQARENRAFRRMLKNIPECN